ncbi:hypothetical protein ANN_05394 [Periplaneta americana]|uniref:Ig-like domain-containing protein n=1 Tax=Periplaneta americana TaxID=6978 RepID=A0ABQ8TCT4_PERAM|nr:hypothetical protein ANN_05394 [Periplaneta americana]
MFNKERIPNLTGEQSDGITVFRIPPMTSLMLHWCRTGAINLWRWWQSPSVNLIGSCIGRELADEWHRALLCHGAVDPTGLNLKTYPDDQVIQENREVVFQCRDEGPLRARVRWLRGNGLPLPPGSRDVNGRLEIPDIQVEHSGTYICEAVGVPPNSPGSQVSVHLTVEAKAKLGIFERKILRGIFGPMQENMQWRIRYNNELYKLYRMEGNRIPKKILEGKIHGKRPIGRPKNRWIDAVTIDSQDYLGTTAWRRLAQDRDNWRKKIEEAKARLWAVMPS